MKGWRLVSFDLDGTLVTGTTISRHLAGRLGHAAELDELEERYAKGEIQSDLVAETQARACRGKSVAALNALLVDVPCISGIAESLQALRARQIATVLNTITWSFAAENLAARFGFEASSGTEASVDSAGILDGGVAAHFEGADKVAFLQRYCSAREIGLSECVAVGDSVSDLPLFDAVGFAVAFNATADARLRGDAAVDSDNLIDALGAVPGLLD